MKISEYKTIYVSCKFGGSSERVEFCRSWIKYFIKKDKEDGIEGRVYINPLDTFGWLYDDTEYQEGLNMTLKLMTMCDEVYVLPGWETSHGCLQEIGIANYLDIPITYI